MRLFDTHTHLNLDNFASDYKEAAQRCFQKDIALVNVGVDYKSSKRAIEIAEEFEDKDVFASVGIHPNDSCFDNFASDFEKVKGLATNQKVVAIGETGLDFFRTEGDDKIKRQKEAFLKHIELALELNKPVVVHCRDAHKEVIDILKGFSNLKCIIHFFTGTKDDAREYLNLGCFISFSGVITFARNYDESIQYLPLDAILIETDAPFVAPVPLRGKRNEPSYVEYTAKKLAEIKGVSFDEVSRQTTKNAKEVFSLK